MNRLMLPGAQIATIDEVANSFTPYRTATHVPIPHVRLVELLLNSLSSLGIAVSSQEHGLAKEGQRYFGLFGSDNMISGVQTMIGLRNAHDMAFQAEMALGAHVMVCSNLCFGGSIKVARKHTVFIERDLPGLIMRGTEKLIEYRGAMADRIERYKATLINERRADHAVCTMVRGRAVMPSQVGHVLAEFAKPSYVEHLDDAGERTVWTLHNAVTEAMKTVNVFTLPKRTEVLQAICDAMVMETPSRALMVV